MSRFDLDPRWAWAARVVERGRFNKNVRRLRRTIGPFVTAANVTRDLGRMFPLLGVLDGAAERGCFDLDTYWHLGFFNYWLRTRFPRWGLLAWRAWLSRYLWTKYSDRPGWNDYYMTLWFMTGNPEHAAEIYRRAVLVPKVGCSPMEYLTASTARWMVSSVRGQHPDFDAAISQLEARYSLPVSSLLPLSPDLCPGVGPLPFGNSPGDVVR